MTLSLFEGFGLELELMIVDEAGLDVLPIADRLLEDAAGEPTDAVERGAAAWSNELQLHVIEMKTNGPAPELEPVGELFAEQVAHMTALLQPHGACLLPTAMHPWMDPEKELKLWPHDDDVIYRTFDRIFDCRGHGWANLQSQHINLPFQGDDELGRLHAAIRIALPLLPALAASSPYVEGRRAGAFDHRLEVYATNAARVPSVSGRLIPEPIYTRADYEETLLGGIYRDLAPFDPDGVLAHEWVNARGAIVRFDRSAIEIRTLDVQEHPVADIAVATMVVALVRALVEERWAPLDRMLEVDRLARIHEDVVRQGSQAHLEASDWLAQLGRRKAVRAGELWGQLADELLAPGRAQDHVQLIASQGTLAERLVQAVGDAPNRERLFQVYRRLADGLPSGRTFAPNAE